MKIGVIPAQLPPDPGGLGETVWAKHRWLRAKGIDARIVTYTPRPTDDEHDPDLHGPEITRFHPEARVGGSPLARLREVRAMARLLQEKLADCDVIEVQGWTLWATALALFPGALARKPWVLVFRGTDGWEYQPRRVLDLKRRVNLRAHTLANSAGLASHLQRLGLKMEGHIWSEVDPAIFTPPASPPDPGRLLSVKGLHPPGDPATLIRALGILKERNVPFRHEHLGMGPLQAPIEELCADLGIEDRVFFMGHVPHREVPVHPARAAVTVLSSRLESCPHVIGEAMMMGLPVVATATTGASELIRDGDTGFLARVGDPEDLAAKIAQALGDPEGAREMGRRARAWALENLHVDIVFAKYLDLYRRLAG